MQLEVGTIVEGKVTGITKFGAFIELPGKVTGMVHISEVANTYVKEIRDHLTENQVVKVKIISIGEGGKIALSIKKAMDPPPRKPRSRPEPQPVSHRPGDYEWQPTRTSGGSFEDMMSRFKQVSDERISDLKRNRDSKHGGFSHRGSGNGQGNK